MESTNRPVLLIGHLERVHADAISRLITSASMDVEVLGSGGQAKQWLQQRDPFAVLLAAHVPHLEQAYLAIRSDPRLSLVPILALAEEITDLGFADLFGNGGDDLVRLDRPDQLVRRLRLIPRSLSLQSAPMRGYALVADADHLRRMVLARVFRNAGFDIRFAANSAELAEDACSTQTNLVVADVDIEPGGAVEVLRKVRSQSNRVPWLIAVPPKKMGATNASAQGLSPLMLFDSFAPAENAMFLANEALRSALAENRASPRLLFGTTVAFRVGGRDRDDYGYVYNISAEGLFIRTMAPLASGEEAWIELQPPRTDRRVRLEARIVWQRLYGPAHGATVPPGFGLRITGGSEADLKRFKQGYEAFAHDMAVQL